MCGFNDDGFGLDDIIQDDMLFGNEYNDETAEYFEEDYTEELYCNHDVTNEHHDSFFDLENLLMAGLVLGWLFPNDGSWKTVKPNKAIKEYWEKNQKFVDKYVEIGKRLDVAYKNQIDAIKQGGDINVDLTARVLKLKEEEFYLIYSKMLSDYDFIRTYKNVNKTALDEDFEFQEIIDSFQDKLLDLETCITEFDDAEDDFEDDYSGNWEDFVEKRDKMQEIYDQMEALNDKIQCGDIFLPRKSTKKIVSNKKTSQADNTTVYNTNYKNIKAEKGEPVKINMAEKIQKLEPQKFSEFNAGQKIFMILILILLLGATLQVLKVASLKEICAFLFVFGICFTIFSKFK